MRNIAKMAIGIIVCTSSSIFAQTAGASSPAAPQAKVSCSNLSADEQQFAFGLTDQNKKIFCGQFTSVQRAAAMQLTSQPSPTGALLSPDDAVAKVAEVNASGGAKPAGGCPVK